MDRVPMSRTEASWATRIMQARASVRRWASMCLDSPATRAIAQCSSTPSWRRTAAPSHCGDHSASTSSRRFPRRFATRQPATSASTSCTGASDPIAIRRLLQAPALSTSPCWASPIAETLRARCGSGATRIQSNGRYTLIHEHATAPASAVSWVVGQRPPRRSWDRGRLNLVVDQVGLVEEMRTLRLRAHSRLVGSHLAWDPRRSDAPARGGPHQPRPRIRDSDGRETFRTPQAPLTPTTRQQIRPVLQPHAASSSTRP